MAATNLSLNVTIKLHYFNVRSRAELIRIILHYADIKFEDYRIELADWAQHKANYPTGKVPMLEITLHDGKKHTITQSMAIARHFARQLDLTGDNEHEAAECDEVVDCLDEPFMIAGQAFWSKGDPALQAAKIVKLKEELARIFGYLEKKLQANGGKHIVGKKLTWADIDVAVAIKVIGDYVNEAWPIMEQYKGLMALRSMVEAEPRIAAYIAKRPATPF